MTNKIVITGAKEHNLKDVSLTIPRDKLIVFTGLSGSGKSSLAFDTIYAEGQRRYVESLSSYARMFLGQASKPDVENIEGLSPAISIDQKTTNRNPRSTVGTVTEIYDYFRLLYARIGIAYCPKCGKKIQSQSIDTITKEILSLEKESRILILAPVVRGEKGTHKKLLEHLKKEGYIRVYVNDELMLLEEDIVLDKNKKHSISVVIDRLKVREEIKSRLVNSVETALKLADGLVICENEGNKLLFSEKFACMDCMIAMDNLEPRSFSFNSPFGMCMDCNGIGYHQMVDVDLVVPNKELSINEGALFNFIQSEESSYYNQIIKQIANKYNFSMDTPLCEAPKDFLDALYYGMDEPIKISFHSHFGGNKERELIFEGIINNLQRRYRETSSEPMKNKIEKLISHVQCKSCNGDRLNKNSLSVRIHGLNIMEITKMSVRDCYDFLGSLPLSQNEEIIAREIIKQIKSRLGFLKDVGLSYLTLNRSASTLSGGESQRIRLATQIGSKLTGVLYVLDEPSIGLHQRDNDKLLKTLRHLTDIGNTVIVVEHDEDTMKEADHIVDIGPYAGIHGGEIVTNGTLEDVKNNKNSITGDYLSGRKKIEIPKKRQTGKGIYLEVKGAKENNLKNIDLKLELGIINCVTGVSGSGKSTLINQILFKGLKRDVYNSTNKVGKHKEILGGENLDKIIDIDQSPIGKTPRSNPATYTGVFDLIRDLFATTNEAKMRGYSKRRLS